MSDIKKCVFAGTFDPPTVGHEKVIDDCLLIFDEVVVAVMENTAKTPVISAENRVKLLQKLYSDNKKVKVISFNGAAVDLLEREKTRFYVRGVRNTIDFEYENADYFASKKLKDDLIEIYIPAEQDKLHISSSLIKNSVKFNKEYKDYIPEKIADDVRALMEKKDV